LQLQVPGFRDFGAVVLNANGAQNGSRQIATLARDLKELRLMAEQLDAEIKTIEDAIKAHMTEHAVDTLITTDVKITWRTVTSSRIDTAALKKQLPDVAAVFTKETTTRRFTVQ
jgi:predicted phage-related endonuclease